MPLLSSQPKVYSKAVFAIAGFATIVANAQ
jgi:hypothetical protein